MPSANPNWSSESTSAAACRVKTIVNTQLQYAGQANMLQFEFVKTIIFVCKIINQLVIYIRQILYFN